MLDLQLGTIVPTCFIPPGLIEVLKVLLEAFKWVIVFYVVLAELLDDDQNEQIEHDVGYEQNEAEEEEWCDVGPTLCCVHAVEHDSIPILTSRYRKQQRETLVEVGKILPVADDVSISNVDEQCVSEHCHDEEDEHEQYKDVEK